MRNKVLAVDPGFDRIGIAILEKEKGKEILLHSECLTTDKQALHEERLLEIGLHIKKIIKEWEPQALSIEKLFFNQNTSTALGVAEARGVIIYEAKLGKLKVYEYSPQHVKMAVTGYGKADKRQVGEMVSKLVSLREPDGSSARLVDDELDAIALGITHLASHRAI